MTSCDFSVGSIVYFLATKTEKVLPAQVVERIDRTSLSGLKSTYILAVRSSGGETKRVEVDPEKIDLFKTPEKMKDFMIDRASSAISILVDQAVTSSSVFEHIDDKTQQTDDPIDEDLMEMESWHVPAAERPIGKAKNSKSTSEKGHFAEVDLGNGRKARMKI